jgi:hypothetical protein
LTETEAGGTHLRLVHSGFAATASLHRSARARATSPLVGEVDPRLWRGAGEGGGIHFHGWRRHPHRILRLAKDRPLPSRERSAPGRRSSSRPRSRTKSVWRSFRGEGSRVTGPANSFPTSLPQWSLRWAA